jgi:putative nucleotidyltransferase with HDIG domain
MGKTMDLLRWKNQPSQVEAIESNRIYLSEILSALSFALDLTEGAVPGHSVRSCLIGMRLAKKLRLSNAEMQSLYYALMLKDIGCSSNAARMCEIIGGDDRAIKSGVKLFDWTQINVASFKLLWQNVLPEGTALERMGRIAKIGMTRARDNEEVIGIRCDRGASIIIKLGLGETAAEAVRCLDEHWDGGGFPRRLKGDRIPLFARILAVSQHLDVFASQHSPEEAINVLKERSGRWFDPEIVRVATALHRENKLWEHCLPGDDQEIARAAVIAADPADKLYLANDQIDNICAAFADVVDAKSPFTFRHSMGVTEAATTIASGLALPAERVQFVRRAALLHDLGKLRVPNSILDKPGKLTDEEFTVIKEHPALTQSILERVSAFRDLAVIAGQHHEKLDGTGYPHRLLAENLTLESRIIAVADIYGALSENRPYREGLPLDTIVSIMSKDIPYKLDPECFEALHFALTHAQKTA